MGSRVQGASVLGRVRRAGGLAAAAAALACQAADSESAPVRTSARLYRLQSERGWYATRVPLVFTNRTGDTIYVDGRCGAWVERRGWRGWRPAPGGDCGGPDEPRVPVPPGAVRAETLDVVLARPDLRVPWGRYRVALAVYAGRKRPPGAGPPNLSGRLPAAFGHSTPFWLAP